MDGLNQIEQMVIFQDHPAHRPACRRGALPRRAHPTLEPLSYLELASLASQARVIVTDSGGLRRRRIGTECRASRFGRRRVGGHRRARRERARGRRSGRARGGEWRRPTAEAAARAVRRRSRLGADRAGARRYDPEPMTRDVAIVGAGSSAFHSRGPRRRRQEGACSSTSTRPGSPSSARARATSRTCPSGVLRPLSSLGSWPPRTTTGSAKPRPSSSPSPRRSLASAADLRILVSAAGADRHAAASRAPRRPRVDHLPGTTREQVQPILEAGSGLTAAKDFHLAFSPERVGPRRRRLDDEDSDEGRRGGHADSTLPRWSSTARDRHRASGLVAEAAELTKLLENIFRSVNIALVAEIAQLRRMDIDVWEVSRPAQRSRSASFPSAGARARTPASRSTRST